MLHMHLGALCKLHAAEGYWTFTRLSKVDRNSLTLSKVKFQNVLEPAFYIYYSNTKISNVLDSNNGATNNLDSCANTNKALDSNTSVNNDVWDDSIHIENAICESDENSYKNQQPQYFKKAQDTKYST